MQGVSSQWPEDNTRSMENGSIWEIEEEEEGGSKRCCNGIIHASSVGVNDSNDVYVAVGNKTSSMDALSWALKHVANQSSLVYLVHVFPEVHSIPTPLGKLPKNQASSEQLKMYMCQERVKRIKLLQKFIELCQVSKVQVDTLLIESDLIVKAIVELIPILSIQRLIIGSTKSNLRKFRGNSKAVQIQKSAPQYCKVKIICDGQEIPANDRALTSPSPTISTNGKHKDKIKKQRSQEFVSCNCFSRKIL